MVRGWTYRLRMESPQGSDGGTRTIDVMSTTPLDVVAEALRAVSNRRNDPKQYRIRIGEEIFGNPGGCSQPHVRRGKTTSIDTARGTELKFTFQSDLAEKTIHRVFVEHVFRSIWAPEDHPLLVNIDGEMPPNHPPSDWDLASGRVESPEAAESRTRRNVRRVDDTAVHCLLDLAMVRSPRRGPIRSHQSGRRRWRDQSQMPAEAADTALLQQAEQYRWALIETGNGYTSANYSHFEQRPCLIEQITLEHIDWCTAYECPGCRGNHTREHLFAGAEVWTTRRGNELPEPIQRDNEVQLLFATPPGRLTTLVTHPMGNRTAAAEKVEEWRQATEEDGRETPAVWIAPDGWSWRGPGERTAVLFQPCDLAGPPNWMRAAG